MSSHPKTRLLLVIPKIVSYRAFLREVCRELVADGVEVHVACSPERLWGESGGCEEVGVQMHGIEFARGMNPAAHLRAARDLNSLVEALRPDLGHAHFSASIFTTALARTPRWPKTIATFHGVSFLAMSGWKATLLRAMETWAVRRLDATWVLTDDDRDGVRAAAPRAAVHTLPGFGLGCDLERFTPQGANARNGLRAEFGYTPEHVVFAFVGRFTDFKGFDLVTRAFLEVTATNPNARLLLVGARDRLHPTGLSASEEAVLHASPQVLDAGFRADVERCLAAADVMVFPSRREGMPVCLMEALALGVPVITSDSRGCREVVRHEVDGLILRERNVSTLVAAMARVLADAELRQKWSAAAVAGRERFSRERFVIEQRRIYTPSLSPVAPATADAL